MDSVWWWVLAITLIILGVIGTFLPVLPGAVLVFGGMLFAAWIDDFQRVGYLRDLSHHPDILESGGPHA